MVSNKLKGMKLVKRLKILYLIDDLTSGGAERLINDILPLMSKDTYCELMILTDRGERYLGSIRGNGIKVTIISKKTDSHIGRILYIKNYIEVNKFEIVHANVFPSIYYCSIVRKISKKKFSIIMTEHNTFNRRRKYRILKGLERWIYKEYDAIVSINGETQESLLSWLEADTSEKYRVVENGVNLDLFYNSLPYKRDKFVKNYNPEDVLLGFVGRFEDQKNHIFMIDVMKRLPTNYKLILVGEGSLLHKVREKVNREDLNGRVVFLGYRDDIPRLMKSFDMVVIPSKWEGFGLVAAESMAAGTPVVCSDVAGLSDVVGEAGIKAAPGDMEAFSNAVIKMANRLHNAGIKDICINQAKKFDIHKTKDSYLCIYREVVKNKNCFGVAF